MSESFIDILFFDTMCIPFSTVGVYIMVSCSLPFLPKRYNKKLDILSLQAHTMCSLFKSINNHIVLVILKWKHNLKNDYCTFTMLSLTFHAVSDIIQGQKLSLETGQFSDSCILTFWQSAWFPQPKALKQKNSSKEARCIFCHFLS